MIIAEGSTFIILLNIVLLSTFLLLKKEHTKYTTLQKFYAIFSHELKTPLTTLQLQLEVLPDLLKKSPLEMSKIDTILQRMNDSSLQLKYEVEKMLSLSQLELAPNYQLEKIDFLKFLNQWREKQIISPEKILFKIDESSQYIIKGNYNLLETIFNNLIRNSLKHSTPDTNIEITAKKLDLNKLIITYNDFKNNPALKNNKILLILYAKS
jgi:signal transduction histidine kinase